MQDTGRPERLGDLPPVHLSSNPDLPLFLTWKNPEHEPHLGGIRPPLPPWGQPRFSVLGCSAQSSPSLCSVPPTYTNWTVTTVIMNRYDGGGSVQFVVSALTTQRVSPFGLL